ncbi:hypothetical protein [Bifidobacterium vansinderenii]|uniref:hypothetical protein n=1 Tax=Bifidobacterium vansinderenii TaxID=1984871 RepID=UPI0018E9C20E|nr:hypothetical protein [Bifidobacterium vansinderenii]
MSPTADRFSRPWKSGGVVVTYRDDSQQIGPIGTFTPYPELNSIIRKVVNKKFLPFDDIVVSRTAYRFTDLLHKEHPEAASQLSNGHLYDVSTNIFDLLPQIFYSVKPDDGDEYMRIFGRTNNDRVEKWVKKRYIRTSAVVNYGKYKLAMSKANGSGTFGEALTPPIILGPMVGNTETFISIGAFDDQEEAAACKKYISAKFTRALLGALKVTQDVKPDTWQLVPLQDFSDHSDVDWSTSIVNIDQQLYRKYGLDDKEIEFIESHVKEMD